MKKIPITDGKTMLVDDRDYWLVRQFRWYPVRRGKQIYVEATLSDRTKIMLHRLVAGFPPFRLDHRNRNGLDNRRCNIRPASASQNAANAVAHRDNTSGFRGVTWSRRKCKWQAQIGVRGKRKFLGYFSSPVSAGAAYGEAARRYFGEFAVDV